MSAIKHAVGEVWDYFKVDDPKQFRQEYSDQTVNRERKPKKQAVTKLAQIYEVFSWYPSHYSAYERRFLLKVDACVLIFTALSFYTKFLDSSNVSNAYVSGMKEELNLKGNELNYFTTFFNVGYCIFQLPLIYLIQKQSFARYLLIACELCWGICTFCSAAAHNANQLYAVRFFVGVSEAVSFPGSYIVMSTWYTPEELVRRAGFYNMMASVGTATSGLLQTACRENLDGIMGRSGWRWQFIIDGVLTLGCTLYGFLLFPGTPETTKRFGLLTEDDCLFARRRMANRVQVPKNFTKQTIKNIFLTWQPYVLTLLWVGHHQVNYESDMKLYLKTKVKKYGESAPTNYAAAAGGVAAISAFLVPNLSAVYGKLPVVCAVLVIQYFCNICLLIWNIPDGLKLSNYFLEHVFQSGLAPTFYAWCANLCRDNAEKKAFVLALINCLSYATQAWTIPLQWNTKYSPEFKMGFSVNVAIVTVVTLAFFLTWGLERWDYKIIPGYTGGRHEYLDESVDVFKAQKSKDSSLIHEEESIGKSEEKNVAVSVKNLS